MVFDIFLNGASVPIDPKYIPIYFSINDFRQEARADI